MIIMNIFTGKLKYKINKDYAGAGDLRYSVLIPYVHMVIRCKRINKIMKH